MSGIRTMYRGHWFRSRAEARWAAFFDSLAWRWRYEPIDLAGYIPDFIVDFHRPLLVEVKGGALTREDVELAPRKVTATAWAGEVLLVGASPLAMAAAGDWLAGDVTTLGLIGERAGPEYSWDLANLFRCLCCGRVSVLAANGSWACRNAGCYDGARYVGSLYDSDIQEKWARAVNVTQWQAA